MNLYLDSSSLLKLFLVERSSEDVERLIGAADRYASSLVAWPEAHAGLARALRSRRVTLEENEKASRDLSDFWSRAVVIDLSQQLAATAAELAARYFLRGLDAIHLASALRLQNGLGEPVTFSAFDDRLNDAAVDSGLSLP